MLISVLSYLRVASKKHRFSIVLKLYRHERALEHARQAVMDCTRDLIHSPKVKMNPTGPDSVKKRVI